MTCTYLKKRNEYMYEFTYLQNETNTCMYYGNINPCGLRHITHCLRYAHIKSYKLTLIGFAIYNIAS